MSVYDIVKLRRGGETETASNLRGRSGGVRIRANFYNDE
jgi:hypothetical protein